MLPYLTLTGVETIDKWIGMINPRRDTRGGTMWIFCWVLQLLCTVTKSIYTYLASFPCVILMFYLFMYVQFGAYVYRLNKMFEVIEEIQPQHGMNNQTKKSTDFRYMKGIYKHYLQCNLKPHKEKMNKSRRMS